MDEKLEVFIRLTCFGSVLLAMLLWELLAPRRHLTVKRPWRWSSNLGLVVINGILARLVMPLTAVGAAELARQNGWGLLNLIALPSWIEIVVALLIFDLAIYGQHVLFHWAPWLWRLHMVHHADLDCDVTTGLRFHTLEILLSASIKLAVVFILGPAAIAVVIFEVLLNASSMFNHGNIRLPGWLDSRLRWLVVTPDMHRVHHSVIRSELNHNFGFNLPWWDRLFGTYQSQPREGHEGMEIGVENIRDPQQTARLPGMLALPFRRRQRQRQAKQSRINPGG